MLSEDKQAELLPQASKMVRGLYRNSLEHSALLAEALLAAYGHHVQEQTTAPDHGGVDHVAQQEEMLAHAKETRAKLMKKGLGKGVRVVGKVTKSIEATPIHHIGKIEDLTMVEHVEEARDLLRQLQANELWEVASDVQSIVSHIDKTAEYHSKLTVHRIQQEENEAIQLARDAALAAWEADEYTRRKAYLREQLKAITDATTVLRFAQRSFARRSALIRSRVPETIEEEDAEEDEPGSPISKHGVSIVDGNIKFSKPVRPPKQSAQEDEEDEEEFIVTEQLRELFNAFVEAFNSNQGMNARSGLTEVELLVLCRAMAIGDPSMGSWDDDRITALMDALDTDVDGILEADEFVQHFAQQYTGLSVLPEEAKMAIEAGHSALRRIDASRAYESDSRQEVAKLIHQLASQEAQEDQAMAAAENAQKIADEAMQQQAVAAEARTTELQHSALLAHNKASALLKDKEEAEASLERIESSISDHNDEQKAELSLEQLETKAEGLRQTLEVAGAAVMEAMVEAEEADKRVEIGLQAQLLAEQRVIQALQRDHRRSEELTKALQQDAIDATRIFQMARAKGMAATLSSRARNIPSAVKTPKILDQLPNEQSQREGSDSDVLTRNMISVENELRELFRAGLTAFNAVGGKDSDRQGINQEELMNVCQAMSVGDASMGQWTGDRVAELMRNLDANANKEIEEDEFVRFFLDHFNRGEMLPSALTLSSRFDNDPLAEFKMAVNAGYSAIERMESSAGVDVTKRHRLHIIGAEPGMSVQATEASNDSEGLPFKRMTQTKVETSQISVEEELKKLFRAGLATFSAIGGKDSDRQGINQEELMHVCQAMSVGDASMGQWTGDRVAELMRNLDANANKEIEEDEFVRFFLDHFNRGEMLPSALTLSSRFDNDPLAEFKMAVNAGYSAIENLASAHGMVSTVPNYRLQFIEMGAGSAEGISPTEDEMTPVIRHESLLPIDENVAPIIRHESLLDEDLPFRRVGTTNASAARGGFEQKPNSSHEKDKAVDTTGDGKADAVLVDTTGDGKVDSIVPIHQHRRHRMSWHTGDVRQEDLYEVIESGKETIDTTGDGVADAILVDTTGDGMVDSVVPLSSVGLAAIEAAKNDTNVSHLRRTASSTILNQTDGSVRLKKAEDEASWRTMRVHDAKNEVKGKARVLSKAQRRYEQLQREHEVRQRRLETRRRAREARTRKHWEKAKGLTESEAMQKRRMLKGKKLRYIQAEMKAQDGDMPATLVQQMQEQEKRQQEYEAFTKEDKLKRTETKAKPWKKQLARQVIEHGLGEAALKRGVKEVVHDTLLEKAHESMMDLLVKNWPRPASAGAENSAPESSHDIVMKQKLKRAQSFRKKRRRSMANIKLQERRTREPPSRIKLRGLLYNEDVVAHAKYLGMDPEQESHLLWIAEAAMNAALPEGWSEHQDELGHVYFYNDATHESSWTHPTDAYYWRLYQVHHDQPSEHKENAAAGAPRPPKDKRPHSARPSLYSKQEETNRPTAGVKPVEEQQHPIPCESQPPGPLQITLADVKKRREGEAQDRQHAKEEARMQRRQEVAEIQAQLIRQELQRASIYRVKHASHGAKDLPISLLQRLSTSVNDARDEEKSIESQLQVCQRDLTKAMKKVQNSPSNKSSPSKTGLLSPEHAKKEQKLQQKAEEKRQAPVREAQEAVWRLERRLEAVAGRRAPLEALLHEHATLQSEITNVRRMADGPAKAGAEGAIASRQAIWKARVEPTIELAQEKADLHRQLLELAATELVDFRRVVTSVLSTWNSDQEQYTAYVGQGSAAKRVSAPIFLKAVTNGLYEIADEDEAASLSGTGGLSSAVASRMHDPIFLTAVARQLKEAMIWKLETRLEGLTARQSAVQEVGLETRHETLGVVDSLRRELQAADRGHDLIEHLTEHLQKTAVNDQVAKRCVTQALWDILQPTKKATKEEVEECSREFYRRSELGREDHEDIRKRYLPGDGFKLSENSAAAGHEKKRMLYVSSSSSVTMEAHVGRLCYFNLFSRGQTSRGGPSEGDRRLFHFGRWLLGVVRGNLILKCNDKASALELWSGSNGWFRFCMTTRKKTQGSLMIDGTRAELADDYSCEWDPETGQYVDPTVQDKTKTAVKEYQGCMLYDMVGESVSDEFNENPMVLAKREAHMLQLANGAPNSSGFGSVDPLVDSLSQFGEWTVFVTSMHYKRAYIYHNEMHRVVQVLATEPGFIVHEDPRDGYVNSEEMHGFGAVDNEVDLDTVVPPMPRNLLTALLPKDDTVDDVVHGAHWLVDGRERDCQRLHDLAEEK